MATEIGGRPVGPIEAPLKTCRRCHGVFPKEENFFRSGKYWQSECKRCHYKRSKYEPRIRKCLFDRLTKETQDAIRTDLKTMKRVHVAIKHGLKPSAVCRWVRAGKV